MADNEAKSTTRKIVTNEQANYYSGITSITVNGKNGYELKVKFLDDLHKNSFSGTNVEDAIEHIEYFLKIVDLIDLPNVNQDKLIVIFPISLVGDAWKCDEIKPTNDETSDLEETNHDDEQEIGEIFRIETNLFDYETPICEEFKEFNYILKIDPDLLTKDIEGFKTYEEFKDDWIYEWNNDVPRVHEKPWTNYGAWNEPTPVTHYFKPFNYKIRCSEWHTCGWREDGYCNGGNLPRAYIIGNSLHYQDYEWYEALKDGELKEEALRNKAIMEGTIDDDDKFEMIKYSFRDDEEYVVVKEDEYDDLTSTSKDACRAYQEIFRMMDEGWMDLAAKKSTKLVKYQSSGFLCVESLIDSTHLQHTCLAS
ncbi:hypothetical protein Tco_0161633 [Tanacetum coccineum]